MEFKAKIFDELSTTELYEILRSRAEIFLLEQNIICQDMDGKDYISLHCFFIEGNRIIGCLRAFSDENNVVTIGRVLTLEHKKGLGTMLMEKSIDEIKRHFSCNKICVHAQKQAVGFYEKQGFVTVSDEFFEAGIPHYTMMMEV